MTGQPVAAAALLALLAAAGITPVATGHDPDWSPVEAAGNPTGLGAIPFKGPVGTSIESSVCPPIADPDRPLYWDPSTTHIGHINGVTGIGAPVGSNYIDYGTIDLWHFENAMYHNPSAMEGPHDVTDSAYSVMMGADGFFRGKMAYTILDGPGTELTITDVHTTRTYCIYGAYEKDGPYMFIDSTYGDPVSSTITNLDLAVFYDPIYATVYPGTPTVNYVFLVTSTYEDEEPVPPVLPVASIALTFLGTTCQDSSVHLSGLGSSAATGIVSYAWDLGDGFTATTPTVVHTYATPGTYTVTLTIVDDDGLTDTTTFSVTSVGDPQCCPDINPISDRWAWEGQSIEFFAWGTDWEGDLLTFSVVPLPAGASWDPTGHYLWETKTGDAGKYKTTVTVSDGTCTADTWLMITVLRPYDAPPAPDADKDGVEDIADNCPSIPNHGQADGDHDAVGDACDTNPGAPDPEDGAGTSTARPPDGDLDGVPDRLDDCPARANPTQLDVDGDGSGDACDADLDGDGIVQDGPAGAHLDDCPFVGDPLQLDSDGDGVGDACDDAPAHADVGRVGHGDAAGADRAQPLGAGAWLVISLAGAMLLATAAVLVALRRRS